MPPALVCAIPSTLLILPEAGCNYGKVEGWNRVLSVVLTVHGGTVPRVILAEVQCVTEGCGCRVVSVRIPQSPDSKPLTVLDRIGHKPQALL